MLFYVKLNNYLIIYFYFLYILAYPRILIFLKNSVSEYRRIAYRYPYPRIRATLEREQIRLKLKLTLSWAAH